MIPRYLDSLSAELRVPARRRARIVAEVSDHLHEAVVSGQTEREAIEAFGEPGEVAQRFHEQIASSSARRASAWTAVLVAAFVVAMAFAPKGTFPFAIVIWVCAQLGAVAGALGVVRWLRYRGAAAVPASRLADVYRANGLALACIGIVGAALAADGAAPLGAALIAASAVGGAAVAQSIARARVVGATAATEDAFEDLLALAAGHAPRFAAVARRLPWNAFRGSPWTFCLAFAVFCGLALAGWHGIVEASGPVTFTNFARALLAGFVIASIEATAVIACFAAFGRFLGIRR